MIINQSISYSKYTYQPPCITLTLYHGTSSQSAKSIQKQQRFKPTKGRLQMNGRSIQGVYFCKNKENAKQIAFHRAKQRKQDICIITCKVILKPGFFIQETHPTWPEVTSGPFTQYCILNYQSIVIESFEYMLNSQKQKKYKYRKIYKCN